MNTSTDHGACDTFSPSGVLCTLQQEGDKQTALSEDNPEAYLAMLEAYHRALAGPLQEIVGSLPLCAGDRALDVACGDGAYSCWLAERVGSAGLVAAVDIAPECLDLAAKSLRESPAAGCVRLCRAGVERLPFVSGCFDLAWCAQSLYSLPRTVESLREIARVVRPGGAVAVLENDTLHDILLPWPVELELEIRTAEWRALADTQTPTRYYVGRWLATLFRELGLERPVVRVWATTWQAPLSDDEQFFLECYLDKLRRQVRPRLRSESQIQLDRLLTRGDDLSLLDRPDLAVTFLNRVVWAVKPGGESRSECS